MESLKPIPAANNRLVSGVINYVARGGERRRYYANDDSKNTIVIESSDRQIEDIRLQSDAPRLAREGF